MCFGMDFTSGVFSSKALVYNNIKFDYPKFGKPKVILRINLSFNLFLFLEARLALSKD